MTYMTGAIVALLAAASTLAAQTSPPVRAFPASAGAALGIASFSPRSSQNGASFSYKGSLVVSARVDRPITRRTGLLLSAGLAPLSQQRGAGRVSTVLAEDLMVGIVDATIGWRFKPTAPVFFAGGGGLTYATKSPVPETSGSVSEPHVAFAIGYDAKSTGAWSVRTVLTNRLIIAADDDDPSTVKKSLPYDWTFEIGGRYTFAKRRNR